MRVVPLVAVLLGACATAPPPRRAPAPPPVDLPRSSIAAILLHRDELGLTQVQVEALERRDDELAREDAALRAQVAKPNPSASASGAAPAPASGGSSGRGGHRPHSGGASQARKPTDPLTRIDDNDTRAYLDVEERVLTAAQRPRAQEIASQYREALYDQQHPAGSR
ncbi:MAG: hypothetical protein ACXWK8_11925 [Myxococcaceae bacterium]